MLGEDEDEIPVRKQYSGGQKELKEKRMNVGNLINLTALLIMRRMRWRLPQKLFTQKRL